MCHVVLNENKQQYVINQKGCPYLYFVYIYNCFSNNTFVNFFINTYE